MKEDIEAPRFRCPICKAKFKTSNTFVNHLNYARHLGKRAALPPHLLGEDIKVPQNIKSYCITCTKSMEDHDNNHCPGAEAMYRLDLEEERDATTVDFIMPPNYKQVIRDLGKVFDPKFVSMTKQIEAERPKVKKKTLPHNTDDLDIFVWNCNGITDTQHTKEQFVNTQLKGAGFKVIMLTETKHNEDDSFPFGLNYSSFAKT